MPRRDGGHSDSRVDGFTLIELLLTISVISVLVALLAPALKQTRDKARRVACMSNLSQVGLALHSYAHDHDGWFCSSTWDMQWLVPGYLVPGATSPFENLSNYVVNSSALYCPACLKKNIPNQATGLPNNVVEPWGSLLSSSMHYGIVEGQNLQDDPNCVLVFERPVYGNSGIFQFYQSSCGNSVYLKLTKSDIYKSDSATIVNNGAGGSTDCAHGVDGSSILYLDGRVQWKPGPWIGPIPLHTSQPPDAPARAEAYVFFTY